eukprot:GFYU01006198.1.p1 GENE.GFYU01006198.1~~GFYU01006198.1.p1  ORF type:complete len:231 (+),score=36.94 GFYU01006198.1:28-720(+)
MEHLAFLDPVLDAFGGKEVVLKLISKTLGYAIVFGSGALKGPQIYNIVKAKSGEGLSAIGFLLEFFGFGIVLAYNISKGYAFSTYGEAALIFIQNIVILWLMQYYSKMDLGLMLGMLVSATLPFVLINGILPVDLFMQATLPIFSASKLPQIVTNFRQGHTGVVSMITAFLYVGGSGARIFTTLAEVDDIVVLSGFMVSFCLNLTLFLQVLWYSKATAAYMKKKDGKKSQ